MNKENPSKFETTWFGNIWPDEPSQDIDLTKKVVED